MREASSRVIQQYRKVNPRERSYLEGHRYEPIGRVCLVKVRLDARLANDHVTFIPCCLKVAARSTAG